jgi:hypothetical protein
MDACSLLLGRPWEFDTDAIHYGRSNKYTLMHKGKKIVLLPMTPTEIVQFETEKKNNAKQKGVFNSENQQPIKLNNPVLLATKSDLDELSASTGPCYALVCKHALYSIEVAPLLCHLLLLTFCRSIWMSFRQSYPPDYHLREALSTRLI